ncbi:putative membrane protein [Legionella geestiana]|uniref:Putative membrane protein n=1 Tax=Legionella geestiana TaxID=45065 RepID=A0A0W0UA96_9GAMM|nr:YqaA family protein [Legionella geestiana]KTD04883.1 putative membrane protein [Legionella geestiana]QBS11293.1 DedA family protein [Legionella geestiana]QDQ40989.1 DedA family protein [Legionella geestiana]STX54072.1 SNARE associated Golgi protein [Legionella geestiana]
MKIFAWMYDKTLDWSRHRHAPWYLAGVSFAESSFFPIPPDVMLLTMGMAVPRQSLRYAFLATLFSVMGGVFGYLIGHFAIEWVEPLIKASWMRDKYEYAAQWFSNSGVWVVILAAFTPLPYKLFTITAGALHMPLLPFIAGSIIGRGARFFLVSGLMYVGGERLHNNLRHRIEVIGWATLALAVIIAVIARWV